MPWGHTAHGPKGPYATLSYGSSIAAAIVLALTMLTQHSGPWATMLRLLCSIKLHTQPAAIVAWQCMLAIITRALWALLPWCHVMAQLQQAVAAG